MAGRSGSHEQYAGQAVERLIAFFRRAEPRGAPPSGWALALDAAIAVGAATGAVYEVSLHVTQQVAIALRGSEFFADPGGLKFASSAGLLLGRPPIGLFALLPPVHPSLWALAAAALTALPLAVRRLYPISAWLVIAGAIVLVHPTQVPKVALGTAVFAAYSAVVHSRYRNLAIAVVAGVTLFVAAALGNQLPRFPGRLTALFAIGPAAAAGLGIRSLRLRLADSAARLRRAAADAEAETRRALAAERSRIAGELHDVVTHNVAVMLIQAGAARKILADSPADAEDALLAVEATGRDAMAELRNLLGLLTPAEDGAADGPGGVPGTKSTAPGDAHGTGAPGGGDAASGRVTFDPQPGLGELDTLVGRVSAAGLPVELRVTGEPRQLPPGVDLAAFRVVQEGLTNVLRHASRPATTVDVRWADALVITVTNSGTDASATPDALLDSNKLDVKKLDDGKPGRGLLGLRERVTLYGGELHAGPRPGGGWQLRAVLPASTGAP